MDLGTPYPPKTPQDPPIPLQMGLGTLQPLRTPCKMDLGMPQPFKAPYPPKTPSKMGLGTLQPPRTPF